MDQDTLKLFLNLSETLHFGKTSRACHISASALTRQIQRLEQQIGHKVFERNNRSVKLTESGRQIRDYARTVLEGWQLLMDQLVEDDKDLKGEIRIYCSVTASLSILPGLLNVFRSTYPNIHIRLQTGDASAAIQKVSAGDCDVAVSALPEKIPSVLAFKVLAETSLVFIAPKMVSSFSGALEGNRSWKDIPFILSERGVARRKIDTWFKSKGIKPNIYAQVSGHEAIISMVALGCGVGIVPKLVIEKSPLKNTVSILRKQPLLNPYTVGICVQTKKIHSPLVSAFWELAGRPKSKRQDGSGNRQDGRRKRGEGSKGKGESQKT
jgi:LysR family positive regulator for ilvC